MELSKQYIYICTYFGLYYSMHYNFIEFFSILAVTFALTVLNSGLMSRNVTSSRDPQHFYMPSLSEAEEIIMNWDKQN